LGRQGILASTDLGCAAGCDSTQTTTHLFLHCTFATNVWFKVWNWLGISSVLSGDLRHHFIQFTKMAAMPHFSHYFFHIIWFATVWMIWKNRNNRVIQNPGSNPLTPIEKIQQLSFLWLKSKRLISLTVTTTGVTSRSSVLVLGCNFIVFGWCSLCSTLTL